MWDTDLDDRLKLGQELGVGAFARVRHGRIVDTGQQVAIKMLRSSRRQDKFMQDLLEREVKILEQLVGGPKLVRLLFTGTLSTHRAVVMELCDYGTMWEALVRSGYIRPLRHYVGLPSASVQMMCRDMVEALRYVHARQIVHADIKPENIFVRREPAGFEYVLGDFGSATVYKSTRVHDYVQSRYYRAPEINLGCSYKSNVTMQIDLWSLGCIVFELLVGRPLFCARNREHLAELHVACLGLPDAALLRTATNASLYTRHSANSNIEPLRAQWSSLRKTAAASDWGGGEKTALATLPVAQAAVLRGWLPEGTVYARWLLDFPQHGEALCSRLQKKEIDPEAHAFVAACTQYTPRPSVIALNLSYIQ